MLHGSRRNNKTLRRRYSVSNAFSLSHGERKKKWGAGRESSVSASAGFYPARPIPRVFRVYIPRRRLSITTFYCISISSLAQPSKERKLSRATGHRVRLKRMRFKRDYCAKSRRRKSGWGSERVARVIRVVCEARTRARISTATLSSKSAK